MKLVVGLGNPGDQYKYNRHNIGFLQLDNYCREYGLIFNKKPNYFLAKQGEAIFLKPRTFMNRCGLAVKAMLTQYPIRDILVVVDDIYLPLGEIRPRQEGGSGGHNGLKSIAQALGSEDFKRLRLGVNEPDGKDLSDYILSDFSQEERRILSQVLDFGNRLITCFVETGFPQVLDFYSANKKSYSEKIHDSQDRERDLV